MGWTFEFSVRPSSDAALFEKYTLAEYIQDNWFVICAVMKDQYGIAMEEDLAARPPCAACRRTNFAFTLQKVF